MISVYLLLDYFRKGKSQQRRSEWRFLLIPQTQSADKLRPEAAFLLAGKPRAMATGWHNIVL